MPKNASRNDSSPSRLTELPALGMDTVSIVADFRRHFNHTLGHNSPSVHYLYNALVLTVRDRLIERWKSTRRTYRQRDCKRGYYLSKEFLLGRTLGNALLSLGLTETVERALQYLGLDLREILDSECAARLGDGAAGPPAVCLLESGAALQLPVMGYGLRYEYGPFRQVLANGRQVEQPRPWLRDGSPWEMERPDHARRVHFYGHSEFYNNPRGELQVRWVDTYDVLARPYDIPVPGYRNGTVNTLRLWKAVATATFDPAEAEGGGYLDIVIAKHDSERITLLHYGSEAGRDYLAWRLRQEYFLVSASLQDALARWVESHGENFSQFAEKNCFQLNDTHAACAVAELMRLLMDEHGLGWDPAWAVTTRTLAYTHPVERSEELEKWPVALFRELLPRLLDIIYEINVRFLAEVAHRWPGDNERLRRMSLVEEGEDAQIRVPYLAIVGSFSVNSVSAAHFRLLQRSLFRDFFKLWPHKVSNKTHGVDPRRWLEGCNPGLSRLLTETLGADWPSDPSRLRDLTAQADQPGWLARWSALKQANKARLAALVQARCQVAFPADALFDVQVESIQPGRRLLLNILHVIHLYERILRAATESWTVRCVLLGGKASPGDIRAKEVIKLICNVATAINADPKAEGKLKVAFLPDIDLAALETICPGADLSEQIAPAGRESSGTVALELMLNGAVTLGTLDGINLEIREAVGEEAFFGFGLSAKEAEAVRKDYHPAALVEQDPDIARLLALLASGYFNRDEPGVFDSLLRTLTSPDDPWLVLADLRGLIDAQRRLAEVYRDPMRWARLGVLNTAAGGRFCADRTVEAYNADIWKLEKVAALPVD